MRVEKIKRKATLCRSDGRKLDVNFFLSPYAKGHSGDIILNKAFVFSVKDL